MEVSDLLIHPERCHESEKDDTDTEIDNEQLLKRIKLGQDNSALDLGYSNSLQSKMF